MVASASIVGGALSFCALMLYKLAISCCMILQIHLCHGFTYAANICRLAMGIVPFISQFHEHEAACSLVNKCFIFYVFQVILL